MRGEVHILVNCPIDTFLKEKQHSAMTMSKSQPMKTNEVAVSRALARSSCGSSCWSCWPTSRASSSYHGPATAGSSSSLILMRWQEKNLQWFRKIVKDICQSTIVCCTCFLLDDITACVDTSAQEITSFPSCRAQPVCFSSNFFSKLA